MGTGCLGWAAGVTPSPNPLPKYLSPNPNSLSKYLSKNLDRYLDKVFELGGSGYRGLVTKSPWGLGWGAGEKGSYLEQFCELERLFRGDKGR
jgi:hypothetical protein